MDLASSLRLESSSEILEVNVNIMAMPLGAKVDFLKKTPTCVKHLANSPDCLHNRIGALFYTPLHEVYSGVVQVHYLPVKM